MMLVPYCLYALILLVVTPAYQGAVYKRLVIHTSKASWTQANWTCASGDQRLVSMDTYTRYCLLDATERPRSASDNLPARFWTDIHTLRVASNCSEHQPEENWTKSTSQAQDVGQKSRADNGSNDDLTAVLGEDWEKTTVNGFDDLTDDGIDDASTTFTGQDTTETGFDDVTTAVTGQGSTGNGFDDVSTTVKPEDFEKTRADDVSTTIMGLDLTENGFDDVSTTVCMAVQHGSLKWRSQDCTDSLGFVCESWELNDTKTCSFKQVSPSCVWDATYIRTVTVTGPTGCRDGCLLNARCWGYLDANFWVTGDSFSLSAGPGCTMVMAETLGTCRPVSKTYSMKLKLCYEYEVDTSDIDTPADLPTTPSDLCQSTTPPNTSTTVTAPTPLTTTVIPIERASVGHLCPRPCSLPDVATNLQQAMLDAHKLQTTLTVPKATLSATRRRKESASDPRDSARYAGMTGAAMLCVVVMTVVVPDLHTLLVHIYHRRW